MELEDGDQDAQGKTRKETRPENHIETNRVPHCDILMRLAILGILLTRLECFYRRHQDDIQQTDGKKKAAEIKHAEPKTKYDAFNDSCTPPAHKRLRASIGPEAFGIKEKAPRRRKGPSVGKAGRKAAFPKCCTPRTKEQSVAKGINLAEGTAKSPPSVKARTRAPSKAKPPAKEKAPPKARVPAKAKAPPNAKTPANIITLAPSGGNNPPDVEP